MSNSFNPDSSHLSDEDRDMLLDQYTGEAESQFAKTGLMRQYVNIRMVRGTDTLVNNRVGKTTLTTVVPGVRPDASPSNFGRVSVTVDTIVLARNNVSLLSELQQNFPVMMEIGEDHGKQLGKFFDEAFIIMAIKGAAMAAPLGINGASLGGAIGAGKSETMVAVGDELDADKAEAKIEDILVAMQKEDIDTSEIIIFVNPDLFRTLRNHQKLISVEYSSDNGDFASGTLYQLAGSRIVMSNRIPTAAQADHRLSNAENGMAYDITEEEARSVAVLLHPRSLLSGETIPLTSRLWYNQEELQWFIESYLSFAVAVNRPDVCGRVLKAV